VRVKYEAIDISVGSHEKAMKSFPRVDCDFVFGRKWG